MDTLEKKKNIHPLINIALIIPQIIFTVLLINVIFQIVYFPLPIHRLLYNLVKIVLFVKPVKIIFFIFVSISSISLVVGIIKNKKVIFRIVFIFGLILNILIMLQIIIFFDGHYFTL